MSLAIFVCWKNDGLKNLYQILSQKWNKVCDMVAKACGEFAMSKTTVYKLYKRFQDGHQDVETGKLPRCPVKSRTNEKLEVKK